MRGGLCRLAWKLVFVSIHGVLYLKVIVNESQPKSMEKLGYLVLEVLIC